MGYHVIFFSYGGNTAPTICAEDNIGVSNVLGPFLLAYIHHWDKELSLFDLCESCAYFQMTAVSCMFE